MDAQFHHLRDWLAASNLYLTKEDEHIFSQHTDRVSLPKGASMMAQNRPVRKLYFLNSGVARLYLRYKDEDITIAFIAAPQFASTIIYLLNQVPSRLAIESCTPVEALCWTREQFLAIRNETRVGKELEMVFAEYLLAWNLKREIDRLTLPPDERYQKLTEEYPMVIQQIPVKFIASYLGIHHDSLSRIRSRLTKRI